MSSYTQQTLIEAPVESVWELLEDPARYPEWNPETMEVTGVPTRVEKGSTFEVTGKGPLDYLTGWRVELAADRLRRGDGTLASIARDVGYGSESALSVAFKRVTGASPTAYRAGVPARRASNPQ